MSRRVPRFVKSALALVCNVRLNGSIRWKDDNVFDLIFHTTAEALCFVKKLAKFFTTMFHFTSLYGNGGTKFSKKAEPSCSLGLVWSRSLACHAVGGWLRSPPKDNYSFTVSICLSITCPVNRSIATCTQ